MNKALDALERIKKNLPAYGEFTNGKQSDHDIATVSEALQSMQWRPISEAPRDGARFFVIGGSMRTDEQSYKLDEPLIAQRLGEGPICIANNPVPWIIEGATHFMHLPPAPQGDE